MKTDRSDEWWQIEGTVPSNFSTLKLRELFHKSLLNINFNAIAVIRLYINDLPGDFVINSTNQQINVNIVCILFCLRDVGSDAVPHFQQPFDQLNWHIHIDIFLFI